MEPVQQEPAFGGLGHSVNRVKTCVICFHYTLTCNETGGLFVFCFCFFYCKLCMIDSHFKELVNVGRIVVFLNLL